MNISHFNMSMGRFPPNGMYPSMPGMPGMAGMAGMAGIPFGGGMEMEDMLKLGEGEGGGSFPGGGYPGGGFGFQGFPGMGSQGNNTTAAIKMYIFAYRHNTLKD